MMHDSMMGGGMMWGMGFVGLLLILLLVLAIAALARYLWRGRRD
ncbi:Na+-transporting methylmalonyl-CoA/oxaloacetate decarboxylase gamma subunit [Constrictibacter sp. MBR-5]|jgi:Na+-transporting methylmalonyl-CoA/oxaloacetate decarboxylase gamma subunit